MRPFFVALCAVVCLSFLGCETPWTYKPVEITWRVKNDPSGSCCHRTMAMLMGAQGRKDLGRWWYKKHWGAGDWGIDEDGKMRWNTVISDLKKAGIPVAYTNSRNSIAFLRWCIENKLGCGVGINGNHMVALTFIDDKYVCIVDNNAIDKTYWIPLKDFQAGWKLSDYVAIAPVLLPVSSPPPL